MLDGAFEVVDKDGVRTHTVGRLACLMRDSGACISHAAINRLMEDVLGYLHG